MLIRYPFFPGKKSMQSIENYFLLFISVLSQPGLTQYPKNYFKIYDPPKGKHPTKTFSKLFPMPKSCFKSHEE